METVAHYKRHEQTNFILKATTAIEMFRGVAGGGITLKRSSDTSITLIWNNEGPPDITDIYVSVQGHISVGGENKQINISNIIFQKSLSNIIKISKRRRLIQMYNTRSIAPCIF